MSDFRFRALISVVFQPLCPACSLFLFRRINDDDDDDDDVMLHVNIKIMMSQQRWYSLLSCFNNKINFLFSCEIRS